MIKNVKPLLKIVLVFLQLCQTKQLLKNIFKKYYGVYQSIAAVAVALVAVALARAVWIQQQLKK